MFINLLLIGIITWKSYHLENDSDLENYLNHFIKYPCNFINYSSDVYRILNHDD